MKTNLTQEQIEYIKATINKDASLTLEDLVNNIYDDRQKELNSMSKEELVEKTDSDKLDIFAEKKGKELANKIYGDYSVQTQQQIDLAKEIQPFLNELDKNNLSKHQIDLLIKYLKSDMFLSDAVYAATMAELDKMIDKSIKDMLLVQGASEEEYNALPKKEVQEIIDGAKQEVLANSPETKEIYKARIESRNKTEKILETLQQSLIQSK